MGPRREEWSGIHEKGLAYIQWLSLLTCTSVHTHFDNRTKLYVPTFKVGKCKPQHTLSGLSGLITRTP